MRRLAIVTVALLLAPCAPAAACPLAVPSYPASVLWVGDSYSAGAGSSQPWLDGEAAQVSRALGWRLRLDAIVGTGFVAPSRYGPAIPARLDADRAKWHRPAFVVIDGGRNDHGSSV